MDKPTPTLSAVPLLVAHWSTKSGKHWLKLYADSTGYSYITPDGGGYMGQISQEQALVILNDRVNRGDFKPDRSVHNLARVDLNTLTPNGKVGNDNG